jgi:L-aspartate oxidase
MTSRLDADVVVVGSGAAGIAAALAAADRGLRVLVVTKDLIGGATPLAQGGLAAAIGPGDTAASHVADTLVAGAGLCEGDVVAALADAAPGAIDWLVGLGAELERTELRLEGGHSHHRIVHSGNDASGAEVHRALLAALLTSSIEILDRTIALDLVVRDAPVGGGSAAGGRDGAGTGTGRRAMDGPAAANASSFAPVPVLALSPLVSGVKVGTIGAGGMLEPGIVTARAVVLAAGGLGQVFATTSNPAGATGDAVAMAARTGAVLRDLEFVQFHPTVLWLAGATGQCPLITEALRGAGAVLRDLDGRPLMAGHHPRGDLAPRDVVAARIHEVISASGAEHVWLDATGLGRDVLEDGFPTVTAACRKYGIDPVTEFIPVAPGAHYSCGGVVADLDGRTTVDGLYAVGEAASTGVQGANRLASNSVTEAVIAGRRAGDAIADALDGAAVTRPMAPSAPQEWVEVTFGRKPGLEVQEADGGLLDRGELAAAMSRWAGVLRDADGLEQLVRLLGGTADPRSAGAAVWAPDEDRAERAGRGSAAPVPHAGSGVDLESVEAANLRLVSWLIAVAALRRLESRGCHRRRDAAGTAEQAWHTLMRWDSERLAVCEEAL